MRGVVIIIRLLHRFPVWNEGNRESTSYLPIFLYVKSPREFSCLLALCWFASNKQTNRQMNKTNKYSSKKAIYRVLDADEACPTIFGLKSPLPPPKM